MAKGPRHFFTIFFNVPKNGKFKKMVLGMLFENFKNYYIRDSAAPIIGGKVRSKSMLE